MTLHVDILFTKTNDVLHKCIYFTCIYRCDQDTKDVLSINEHVLNQFKKDEPNIKKLYTKSDNAGCYHTSYSPEALYFMCKQKGMELLRYDYNESCKGKDQCDRESAAAKTILRSYVDAGNDLMTAEDIYEAMHYGIGVKYVMISVAEIDSTVSSVSGPKVSSFTSYHSIAFTDEGMRLWR